MMLRRLFINVLVSVLFGNTTTSQTSDVSTKFRLAQSYEQAGSFEQAAKLYKELTTKEPTNPVYLESLSRMYVQLKQYDDAIALFQTRLALTPADMSLHAMLGSVYHKAGREEEASTQWDKVIQSDPTNPIVYRSIANVLVENRLLERAADMYRRARIACNDPNLFTLDLSHLLTMSMDYAGATEELLSWLRQNPAQLSFVQSRMATFTGKEGARHIAREVVQSELRKSDDARLYELLAWLYLEGKDFAEAFDVYKKLDRISNAQGAGIYAFAERAFKEGAFVIAAQAYQEAINIPVSRARLPYAKYGYASALKELSALADTMTHSHVAGSTPATESQPTYFGAVAYFRGIIKEYPYSEFSAKSYYQIGLIQYERFFDLDGALSAFQSAETELPGLGPVQLDVRLRIAAVLTSKGDTAGAAKRLLSVVAVPNALPDQQDEAGFRLAELDYYAGRFATAVARLEGISSNTQANFANDALSLLALLRENASTAEQALREIGRADFLVCQHRYSEALPVLRSVIDRFPQALLVDDALMRLATLQATMRMYGDAIGSYQRLLTQFKESSIALDKAQFNIGDVYQYGLNDKIKAVDAYERLLADYPQSILVVQARKRIRELRGDSF